MVHVIRWQHGDSTHLKVIYNELFIWLEKSSVGGGNSLALLWLWVAFSKAGEGILGLEDPWSPWQTLDLRIRDRGWGRGKVSDLREPTHLIASRGYRWGREEFVCSLHIPPPFLPPSLFPLFISF